MTRSSNSNDSSIWQHFNLLDRRTAAKRILSGCWFELGSRTANGKFGNITLAKASSHRLWYIWTVIDQRHLMKCQKCTGKLKRTFFGDTIISYDFKQSNISSVRSCFSRIRKVQFNRHTRLNVLNMNFFVNLDIICALSVGRNILAGVSVG